MSPTIKSSYYYLKNLSTQDIEQYITYPVEIEMANLPGVKEIRSISKFGLSVVTIVFEDDLGPIYLDN
jgi:cobalt-zinc-cadmium resistance protein CzcA